MDYNFSDLSPALSALKELNSIDIAANLSPALKAASQCLNTYEKLFQDSTAMQTALKTLSNTLQVSSYKDFISTSGISVLSSMTKNLSSLNMASLGKTVLDSAAILNTESDSQDFIELDGSIIDIIKEVDESIQLPASDDQNNTRIKKTNSEVFWQVISIIVAIIAILQAAYYHNIDTASSTQSYNELLQEEKKQTREEEKQTAELIKQTELLNQIENNTATDATSQESSQLPCN